MKIRKVIILLLGIAVVSLVALFISISLTMSKGSAEGIAKIKDDLHNLTDDQLSEHYGSSYHKLQFTDGVAKAISKDSHHSFNGGNLVFLFPDGRTFEYMGHVCGNGYSELLFTSFISDQKLAQAKLVADSDDPLSIIAETAYTVDGFYNWLPKYLDEQHDTTDH